MTDLPTITPRADAEARREFPGMFRRSNLVSDQIKHEVEHAARKLRLLASLADMANAGNERVMREEAASFIAYLGEITRVCDDMLRDVIRLASDNVGALSAKSETELTRSHIVSDAVGDNWIPYFELAAIGSVQEPPFYRDRYVRRMREAVLS